MWSVFEEILNFDPGKQIPLLVSKTDDLVECGRRDDWLLARTIKTPALDIWDEGELGDSCCFGVRTVESSTDSVWKMHGGV